VVSFRGLIHSRPTAHKLTLTAFLGAVESSLKTFGVPVMTTLQERLDRVIERHGENSKVAQAIRNQILAERSNKSFKKLYTSGSVNPLNHERDQITVGALERGRD
jgi:hypothetical protein